MLSTNSAISDLLKHKLFEFISVKAIISKLNTLLVALSTKTYQMEYTSTGHLPHAKATQLD